MGTEGRPNTKHKADTPFKLKVVDHAGDPPPSYVSGFKYGRLAVSPMRAAILPDD